MAKFCTQCGTPLEEGAKFCTACGAAVAQRPPQQPQSQPQEPQQQPPVGEHLQELQGYVKKGFSTFTSTINTMAGEEGEVKIPLRDLFSQVFKKHSVEEREALFVCGTKGTTPKESEMIGEWPKPWLYARVLLMFALVFAGLYFMLAEFGNANAIPGAIFVGALAVPFAFLVFFWEVNVPRNINIFDVITTFFVGGVFSLIATLIIFEILGTDGNGYIGAIFVGIAEEVGKALVVAYYIKRRNVKYKLNGLLLGASVGAGFAVFETAGYAFRFLLNYNLDTMMDVLLKRGALSIGGHVIWAAIAGFGLVVAKGEEELNKNHVLDPRFLKFLGVVIALHAVWDMPIKLGSKHALVQWCMTAIGLVVVFTLINSGLKQVATIAKRAQEAEAIQGEGALEADEPAAVGAAVGSDEES